MIKNVGVLLSAGIGERFGSKIPKQYIHINNRELISYSIDALKNAKNIDALIVMVGENEMKSHRIEDEYGVTCVLGGATRAESFNNALIYCAEHYPECENILFHEAARPLITTDVFEKYFDLLEDYDCVYSCKHITDSLGSYTGQIPKREDFYLIQAPEAYRFKLLQQHFDVKSEIYFAAFQLPNTTKAYRYFDIKNNFKLTRPDDVPLIEYCLEY